MNTVIIYLKRRNTAKTTGRGVLSQSVVFIVTFFTIQVAITQEPEEQEDAERESMEEVIVTSPPSISSMAAEVTKAQLNAYSVFNSLNDDNEFDVLCRKERPLKLASDPIVHSAPVMVCHTRFVRRETARDNELFAQDPGISLSPVDYVGHAEELRDIFRKLTREHPELQEAMSNWVTLKAKYDEAKAEDMKSNFFARLFKSKD